MQVRVFSPSRLSVLLRVLVWSSLMAGGILLVGCSGKADQAQGAGGHGAGGMPAQQAMPVPVVKVHAAPFALSFEYPAQISGVREVEIRPRVSGIVQKRLFEEGAPVKQGQSLYQLDEAPYQTALSSARADLEAARVKAEQARRDFERVRPLIADKAISQADYDNAQSALQLAKANVGVAQARVQEAELNVGYARVYSPVSGFIGRSLKSEGTLVSGAQDLLVTVTQVDKVYANFGLSQADHDLLKEGLASGRLVTDASGLKVEVLVNNEPSKELVARLAFQDVRVDPATGTVEARALLDNHKGMLSPGQFVRVRVSGASQKEAVLLPQRAVIESPMGGKLVMTVGPDNKVAPRPVTVAQWHQDQWVITSGLKDGELVMTDGFIKAQPGMAVQPMLGDESKTAGGVKQDANAPAGAENKAPAGAAAKSSDVRK